MQVLLSFYEGLERLVVGGTFRFHEPSREDFRPNIGNVLVFDASKLNVHSVDSIPSGIRQTLLVWVKGE